jgi:hypothetical protein
MNVPVSIWLKPSNGINECASIYLAKAWQWGRFKNQNDCDIKIQPCTDECFMVYEVLDIGSYVKLGYKREIFFHINQ